MNIVLSEYVKKSKHNAGNKARSDTIKILCSEGYKHIPLYHSGKNKLIIVFSLFIGIIRAVFNARKKDDILIQYPYYPDIVNRILFSSLLFGRKIRKYRLSLIVHDVLCMRTEKFKGMDGLQLLKKELMQIDKFNKIICHNERMARTFIKAGGQGNYVILGPFDYIYKGEPTEIKKSAKEYVVIIAGNLDRTKCGFLYKLPEFKNISFHLYGMNYSGDSNENIKFQGEYPPDELIENLNGHFGLVWDGDTCSTCGGIYGTYLKYNNPHKFSLYLAAGLPVIVWEDSAVASYVKENKIGVCVKRLEDLEKILENIDRSEYLEMVSNVRIVREEIIQGKHLKMAALQIKDEMARKD